MHPDKISHLASFLIISGLVRWPGDAEQIATLYVHDLYVMPAYHTALDAEVERMAEGV